MLELICLFFPAFILLRNKNLNQRKYIEEYIISNLQINIIIFLILFILKKGEVFYLKDAFNLSFGIKYLALALLFALTLPYILNELKLMKKNITIKIKITKKEKNEEN